MGGPRQVALLALLVRPTGAACRPSGWSTSCGARRPRTTRRGALQVAVAKLRRQLEPRRQARGEATLLVTRAGGYALDLPPGAVDAARFAALLDAPARRRTRHGRGRRWSRRSPSGEGRRTAASRAGARAGDRGAAARRARWSAVERLWDVRLGAGGHAAAVPELRALVEEEPLREELWRLLVLALYRSGRQAEALRRARGA